MLAKTKPITVTYGNCSVSQIKVVERDEEGGVLVLELDEKHRVSPTVRFWTSLCSSFSTYGMNVKLFKLFRHDEVFDRLQTVLRGDGKDRVRYTIEDRGDQPGILLAVTNPTKTVIDYDDTIGVLGTNDCMEYEYYGGIVRSIHRPKRTAGIQVGGDDFEPRFVCETPIDGFGSPLIYLSLLREACQNGMIAYTKTFRSEVSLGRGNDARGDHSLDRALDAYSNDEGYEALVSRLNTARNSWASILESQQLYQLLLRAASRGQLQQPEKDSELVALNSSKGKIKDDSLEGASPVNLKVMKAFNAVVGDLVSIYKLTHMDALAKKRQGQLPCEAKVYELMNLATEVATHYMTQVNSRPIHAWVGTLVSNEYDLENTVEQYETFRDWMVDADVEADPELN